MSAVEGRTRWTRTVVAGLAGLVAAVGVTLGMGAGVFAAQFLPGGIPVALSVGEADVRGLGGSADQVSSVVNGDHAVIALAGETVTIDGLCAVMKVTPPIGPEFVIIARAPQGAAGNLALATENFTGNAHAERIIIGRDAGALTRSSHDGPAGGAGLQADAFVLSHGDADVLAVSADTFALQGLTVELAGAGSAC